MSGIATHTHPVWIGKADFLIRADLGAHGMPGRSEQLWARRVSPNRFELCCIPFFAYGFALGDQVECDDEHVVQKRVAQGGHETLRVAIVGNDESGAVHFAIHDWVIRVGLLHEFLSPGYLAVDIPPDQVDSFDLSVLENLADKGLLEFERSG